MTTRSQPADSMIGQAAFADGGRKRRPAAAKARPAVSVVPWSPVSGAAHTRARSALTACEPAPSGVPSATSAIPASAPAMRADGAIVSVCSHGPRGGAMPAQETSIDVGGSGRLVPFSARAKRSVSAASGTTSSRPSSSGESSRCIRIASTSGVESPIPCGKSGATVRTRTSEATCRRIAPSGSSRCASEVNAARSDRAFSSAISRVVIGAGSASARGRARPTRGRRSPPRSGAADDRWPGRRRR